MNIFRCIGREIDRLYQETLTLIARARRGELPSTTVDPKEVLGPCAHCGTPVRRDEGGSVGDRVQVHLTCREADNRERKRVLAGYRIFGEIVNLPLRNLDNDHVAEAIKAGIKGIPPQATIDAFRGALMRIRIHIHKDARIPFETRRAADAIIDRGFEALKSADLAGN